MRQLRGKWLRCFFYTGSRSNWCHLRGRQISLVFNVSVTHASAQEPMRSVYICVMHFILDATIPTRISKQSCTTMIMCHIMTQSNCYSYLIFLAPIRSWHYSLNPDSAGSHLLLLGQFSESLLQRVLQSQHLQLMSDCLAAERIRLTMAVRLGM
jgi:hypothetical protein